MRFLLHNSRPIVINRPELIHTPRLLVLQDRLEYNVARMRELLHAVNPRYDLRCLCPHVKTTKSGWVTRFMLRHGISFYKASLNEIDMLINCRVPKIFVAYPLLERDAQRLAEHIRNNPDIQFYVQIARPEHVNILEKVSREKSVNWHYYIDADVGMSRTGIAVEEAYDFFCSMKDKSSFVFAGLHAYDGHIHYREAHRRRDASFDCMARVEKTLNIFQDRGVQIPNIIVGGTPSFLADAEYWSQSKLKIAVYFSPGTWIYFDSATNEMMPNSFDFAAVILAQVIDKPSSDTATLNLGHKRWAVDSGPIDTFSIPNMRAVQWSEEHTVVHLPGKVRLNIGDYVMIVPRHVCSTVNLWEDFGRIDENGEIVEMFCPIDGRNR